jgi:hypothetical protein
MKLGSTWIGIDGFPQHDLSGAKTGIRNYPKRPIAASFGPFLAGSIPKGHPSRIAAFSHGPSAPLPNGVLTPILYRPPRITEIPGLSQTVSA